MRIFRDDRKGSRRKRLFDPLVISILIHLLLAIVLLQKDVFREDPETAAKKEKDYIEISEIPVQEEEETEPPKKPSVLADRSRKAKEEKTIDETTRLTRQTQQQDLRKPSEKTTPDREEEAKKTAEKSEQPEEKKSSEEKEVVKKEPPREKQSLETVKKEPGEIQEKQQQDTSQEETTDEKKVTSSPRSTEDTPEKIKKDLSEIGRKLVRSTPSRPSVPDAPSSDKKPMYGADVPKKEDTVDLSTKEFKYVSYFTNLKRKIDGVWNYPEESQVRGETGRLFLIFTIKSNGDLEDIELLNSSGYQRLDNEAIRAIKVASPFNPFPDSWDLEKLNIRASFEYRYSRFLR